MTDRLYFRLISFFCVGSVRNAQLDHSKFNHPSGLDRSSRGTRWTNPYHTAIGRHLGLQGPSDARFCVAQPVGLPTEIPQRFTFSLLPPSFAAGRCATFFFSPAGVLGAGRQLA